MNLTFIVIAGLLFGNQPEMETPVTNAAMTGIAQRQGLIVKTGYHSHENMEVHKMHGTEKLFVPARRMTRAPKGAL
jgi:hypothetical protein